MPLQLGIALLSLTMAATAALAAEEAGSALPDARWGLAPARWRGLLSMDLRQFRNEGQRPRLQRVDSGQVQVSSYVWQPWFAQVQGGLGFVSSHERGESEARSTNLTGNGMLNLFPVSRFPFHADFDASDSRSLDQFTGQTYESRRYNLRQTHRSVSGAENSSGAFGHSRLESSSFGRDILDVVNASHSRRVGTNSFDANADRTRNRREGSNEHAQFTRLFGRHGWSSGGLSTVDTSVNYGESDLELGAGGTPIATRNEFFQVNNVFTWRREDDDPFYLTGGARYFENSAESPAASIDSRSIMGHVNGNYRYGRNLLLNGGASEQQVRSGGASEVFGTQSLGATYTADPKRFDAYLYNINVGANAQNQTGGDANRRLGTAQLGHSLQRTFEPEASQNVTATLAQTVSETRDSVAGPLRTLSHNGSLMWRTLRGNALAGLFGASAADSRTRGHTNSTFQLVNLQGSGQAQFDRNSMLLGNLTLQGTRQATGNAPLAGTDVNVNGGATYQHQRAFDVPRLRYLAIYERNDYRLNARLEGDLNATREHVAWSFEQRLEYRIGKLELRGTLRFAEVDGKESALVFIRLARELGD